MGLGALDAHASVDDHAAVGKSQDRVEVELRDSRHVESEMRKPLDEVDERREVCCWRAAESTNETPRLPLHHELLCVDVGHGRDPE